MKYKEFKEKVERWGRKHGYVTEVIIEELWTDIKVESNGESHFIACISTEYRCALDTNWEWFCGIEERARAELDEIKMHAKAELFDIIVELAKTPPKNREDVKRFIIPLPGLVTADGKQQYLSYENGNLFASKRDENLCQTWSEGHLELIPEGYRQFAVEFKEGNR